MAEPARPFRSDAFDQEMDEFESTPLTRSEYLSVLTHFYRGEVGRSTAWRARLDATTNWAILTCAAVLSFTFGSKAHPHVVMLLGHVMLWAYLLIEARRYRYFEVYRARVRMLEENFLIPVLTRQLESPMRSWRDLVAMDLDLPKFKSTLTDALGFRLRANYLWMFIAMSGGWIAKVCLHPTPAESFSEAWSRLAVGPISPGFMLLSLVCFYLLLAVISMGTLHRENDEPVDEMVGVESQLDHWKL